MNTPTPEFRAFLQRRAMLADMLKRSVQEFNCWREQNPTAGIILEDVDLHGLNLSGVNLQGANLAFTDFRGANLTNADLSRSYYWEADFAGAVTKGTRFRDAWEAEF